MADSLTLKEVELDYEADEPGEADNERIDSPCPATPELKSFALTPDLETDPVTPTKLEEKDDELGGEDETLLPVETDMICSPPAQEDGEEKEKDEESDDGELEDGEISDEDEALKSERLEPKPVCRFFSKGQCTWGQSCRFLHPGVLDKGNYSMFAAPRPILPGEAEQEQEISPVKQVMVPPPVPAYESAWERGLRQAKEMRRRSSKRREMDVEYEEKKASLSLTQVELDKENDYYMRPASPAYTHDPYAEDYEVPDGGSDRAYPEPHYSGAQGGGRRIAPPPPPDFLARSERGGGARYPRSPPPRPRQRVAPPRSPEGGRGVPTPLAPQQRRGEAWADPWMRGSGAGGQDKKPVPTGGRGVRRRSYSSGSSRSSSGSSRSRSPGGRRGGRARRYSGSSYSSYTGSSRSRSRSSSPDGIPRRDKQVGDRGQVKKESQGRSSAPLQKRLAGVSTQQGKGRERVKAEDKDRKRRGDYSSDDNLPSGSKSGRLADKNLKKETKLSSESSKHQDHDGERPTKPFKMNLPKNQIKLTLKNSTSTKPINTTVLEKLGMSNEDLSEAKKALKKKNEIDKSGSAAVKKQNLELMEALKERLKKKQEDKILLKPATSEVGAHVEDTPVISPVPAAELKSKEVKKLKAKLAGTGVDSKGRREELLKQLKAVEDAIHRKRTKLDG